MVDALAFLVAVRVDGCGAWSQLVGVRRSNSALVMEVFAFRLAEILIQFPKRDSTCV